MKKLVPALAIALTAATAQQAMANDAYEYPYFGVTAGIAELDEFCDGASSACDDDGTFYRIYSGARLLPFFGSEVGFTHNERFGSSNDGRLRPQALDFTTHWYIPLGEYFDVFAKAGAFAWRARVSDPGASSTTETGIDFKTGLGLRLGLGSTVSLRFDLDYIPDYGSSDIGGSTDLVYVGGGLQFSF